MGNATLSTSPTGAAATEPLAGFELQDFTASCEDAQAAIVATVATRADLARRLDQMGRDLARRNPRMPKRQVRHIALIDLINEARDDFPPQEFTIHTDLGDGNAAIDTVASAEKLRAKRMLAELLETPAETAQRQAARDAKMDAFTVRAHGHILETLLFGRG